ncbi:MAG TPA: fumarylacetoacetate hydrolase family protein, partial [Humisphaera sp.]|nr:fumarylacetoacetate hydrolase family protein [Humisphaera sp.]
AGVIAASRILHSPARLHAKDYGRLGIEFEICVRLASDLPRSGVAVTRADAAAAVGSVAPAFEVIDDRNAEYAGLDILSVVADNSWNAGAVFGEFKSSWPDLANVEARLHQDGEKIDSGRGREILGHPFESVAWLANHLATRGRTLRAGQLVMTGSILRTLFPKDGETYRLDIGPIGNVEVTIAD